jgi:predicted NBD/HSP70 family sugar kinase
MIRQGLLIGIDLGATGISTALVNAAGKTIAWDYCKTRTVEEK